MSNIYPPTDNLPVAYASNNVNSTADVARGSLNQSESKALDNGYKFVWEFTPSQGNGTIAAAALTSCWGGTNAFGSSAGTKATFQMMKRVNIGNVADARKQMLFNAVAFDWEKEILISITYIPSGARSGRRAAAIRDAAGSGSIPPRAGSRGSMGTWISISAIRTFRR